MSQEYTYPGDELLIFAQARNWKKYFSNQIRPHIRGKVLEVGAGIGNNTATINDGTASTWLLLEPDPAMAASIEQNIQHKLYPPNTRSKKGTVNDIDEPFDTIIYIDVLEHIENDSEELKKAKDLLNENGKLIVLSPAFRLLFSPFDKAIGHYRRYNRRMFKKITPAETDMISCRYYDSMGYFASLVNKLFLKQKAPTMRQVVFWDRRIVPVSTVMDKIFFHSFGKSIVAIWKRN